jgi:signal-transduction protein with cAMP-binding, CBS, and nucleotidyltransferase domain
MHTHGQGVLDYVAPLSFFAALPPETGLAVLRQCALVQLPPNTLVYRQGDAFDMMYVVIGGAVSIHVRTGGSPERSRDERQTGTRLERLLEYQAMREQLNKLVNQVGVFASSKHHNIYHDIEGGVGKFSLDPRV